MDDKRRPKRKILYKQKRDHKESLQQKQARLAKPAKEILQIKKS